MPQCDIVIPTYNSAHVLPLTFAALGQQAVPAGWTVRVLVSDDGSTDATLAWVAGRKLPPAWSLTVITGEHKGSAVARNRALAKIQGDITLLLGADMILQPHGLAAHLDFHQRHPAATTAALGWVVWDPRLNPSPLMEWTTHGGPQNDFDALLGVHEADPRHFFYGSHLSLKTALLANNRFAEAFTEYGWEDLELGRRLAGQGLQLRVLPAARTLHHHAYSATAFSERQYAVGKSLPIYQQLARSTSLLPRRSLWRQARDRFLIMLGLPPLLRLLVQTIGSRRSLPGLYQRLATVYFWWGVYDGKRKKLKF